MTAQAALYLHASARENVLEHLFVGEMLRTLWCKEVYDVEVLRSEVDNLGYDLVVECGGVTRHIQLKSTHKRGAAKKQNINIKIMAKSSGCVVWMFFDSANLKLGPFLWLGEKPGKPLTSLGNKIARHAKGNSKGIKGQRRNIREVGMGQFCKVSSMTELIHKLFGDIARGSP